MRKILIIAGMLLCIFLTTLSAQPRVGKDEEILKKLDQVLDNQKEMFEYLRFIKNRAR